MGRVAKRAWWRVVVQAAIEVAVLPLRIAAVSLQVATHAALAFFTSENQGHTGVFGRRVRCGSRVIRSIAFVGAAARHQFLSLHLRRRPPRQSRAVRRGIAAMKRKA